MRCKGCPTSVPVVSDELATHLAIMMPDDVRHKTCEASLAWLVTRHEGLSIYLGINGRGYTPEERNLIAGETPAVASLPCPYYDKTAKSGCILGGLGRRYSKRQEANKAPYGWLPTMLMRRLDPQALKTLVKSKEIADAKVTMLTRNDGLG